MHSSPDFLAIDTEAAALMRALDSASSPLGAPESWPPALRTLVNMVLNSKTARYVAWGPQLCLLYNDAYVSYLEHRHPAAMGRPIQEVWHDYWAVIGPLYARALAGEALALENKPFKVVREGRSQEIWVSFSYTPLYEDGAIRGIFGDITNMTSRVLAERNRNEEARRLHQLFEQAPGMIAVLRGPQHVYESANPAYQQLVGQRELLGRPVAEALPEFVTQGIAEVLDRVYATGEPYRANAMQVVLQNAPGAPQEHVLDFVCQPIREDDDSISGIFVEAFDITDKIKSAQAFQESELRLYQLANTIPQLAWMADADGKVHWYNDRWYEYSGTTNVDMENDGWQKLHHPDELPWVLEMWRHSLIQGEPFGMTFPLRGKDGIYRPFYTLVAPLKDSSGKIVRWFGTNTDVSSLHAAQQALSVTEEWLQESLLTGRMVAWEWDLSTQEIKYSDNSPEVIGYASGSSAVGLASIHPDDAARFNAAVALAIETCGEFHELTRRIRPDNGQLIWIEIKGRATGAGGKARQVRGIMIDVTERMTTEQSLKDVNRRKDEFLAMLAHELRNPLAPISTAARLLKIDCTDENRVRSASEIIERQVGHMTELVDDLLDVSRVTRGLSTLEMETVDIKTVVFSAIEQARPLIEARHHALTTRMTSAPAVVNGDRTRLIQVVSNLLNNAAKYTPMGGRIELIVETAIDYTADEPADHGADQVVISVKDNGVGIDPVLLPKVFELFTQAERTPDRAQGGLGLGLALVKSLMELHGGSVQAHSEGHGCGSTFSVKLPLLHEELRPLTEAGDAAVLAVGGALHVMVVDDNVDAGDSLAALLEVQGHQVTVVNDPLSALELASENPPDVFILDIGLPDMDGNELARRLRSHPATASALYIALTGYGQDRDRLQSKAAGFDYHFVKPIKMEDLDRLLNPGNI